MSHDLQGKSRARNELYQFALKQYDRSVRAMWAISPDSTNHVRNVLIASLLVVVFENLEGQPILAFSHSLVMDRVLSLWLKNNTSALDYKSGISSPVAGVIETDLLMTMIRFDLQLMTFVDRRSVEIHQARKDHAMITIEMMPSVFMELAEAITYGQLILWRTYHYVLWAASQTQSMKLQREFSMDLVCLMSLPILHIPREV